jgi:hypothetical protein
MMNRTANLESMEVGIRGSTEDETGTPTKCKSWRFVGLVSLFVLAAVGIAVGVGVGVTRNKESQGQQTGATTTSQGQQTSPSTAFVFESTVQSKQYKYLTYDQIVQRLKSLQATYPTLAEVFTAQDRFTLPSAGSCTIDGISQPCKVGKPSHPPNFRYYSAL